MAEKPTFDKRSMSGDLERSANEVAARDEALSHARARGLKELYPAWAGDTGVWTRKRSGDNVEREPETVERGVTEMTERDEVVSQARARGLKELIPAWAENTGVWTLKRDGNIAEREPEAVERNANELAERDEAISQARARGLKELYPAWAGDTGVWTRKRDENDVKRDLGEYPSFKCHRFSDS